MRTDEDDALRTAMSFKVEGQRKQGQQQKIWRRQVEEEISRIGLQKKDALIKQNGIKLIMSERR